MSLSPTPKPQNDPLPRTDWGQFGRYGDGNSLPGDDRLSPQLGKKTVAWLLGILFAIVAGLLTIQIVAPTGNPAWLILLMVGVTGFALLWRNFEWGIVAYLCVAWMVVGTPDVAQGGSGGGQKVMISQLGIGALLLVWGLRKLFSYDLRLYKTPVNLPIFAYLAFAAWSTINSVLFPNPDVIAHSPRTYLQVNILEYGIRFLALMGCLLVGNALSGKYVKYAAIALLIPGVATFSGILWFIPYTSYQAFAQILAMAVLAAFALLDRGAVWMRVAAAGIALAIFGVYFIRDAEWVSGWLGGIIALALITWRANRKLFLGATAVIALIVVLNIGYFWKNFYTANFYGGRAKFGRKAQNEQGQFTNDRSRMLLGATMYAEHFPIGIGLGNYRAYNQWFGREDHWNTTTFTSAHGTYAQVISETGWGGFALFMLLLYSNASLMNRTYKALPEGRWKNYVLGGWAGCIGVYVASFNGDYFFPAYHNGGLASFGSCLYTHLMVGVVIAVARMHGLTWNGKPIAVVQKENPAPITGVDSLATR